MSSLSGHATQRVIVLLRNEHTSLGGARQEARRAEAFAADQAPIVAQLRQLHSSRVVTYRTVNAVATTVSAGEETYLRKDPAVLAVDPDSLVTGPSTDSELLTGGSSTASTATGTAAGTSAAGAKVVKNSGVCGTASAPLLEPEALHLINADNRTNADSPYKSGPASAHSLGYTGAGVNIAVFPDGMDPSIPDFQRGGHSVVTDYQDFTGEGTAAKTSGDEAFGDVSSLVDQGNTTYNLDQEINPIFATKGGTCDVRVLGVAPGATVDVMKVFGDTNSSYTSVILQGIDWAIQKDHANILSISIGFFGLPTTAAEQPLTKILENAMADGTTVVASTGDASPSNTEESPALDPGVIGAAASTSYQIFAQTNFFLYDMAEAVHDGHRPTYHLGQNTPGWLDDQVSTLSSSGVTEDRRMPDILAPGDLNWASCSTDTVDYTGCANALGGQAIGIYDFGGTSESAPLTSGVAALVIQAYREAHGGKTPSPSDVRQIIFSSASDIGVAADEQGAGLLNALRAVQLAKTFGTHGAGGGLVESPSSIADLGAPGTSHSHTVTVTNTGATAATVAPALRTLGPASTLAQGHMSLFEASDAGFQGTCADVDYAQYYTGEYIPELNCHRFTVPAGVSELDSRIAWNPLQQCSTCTAGDPTAREILIDPKGRYANYSDPQGDGAGFADAQVHQPTPGTWTLLIFGRATSDYNGPVSYSETAQTFQDVKGAVSPASQVVAPGRSASFSVKVTAPSTPGFFTGAVVFNSSEESAPGTIPVASEAEVPVSTSSPGHFTGTLTGGNGRAVINAQELSYEFHVPKGLHDLDVNMTTSDDGYLIVGQLVDPNGRAVDSEESFQVISPDEDNANTHSVQLVWANPMPGTWRVDVGNGLFYLPGLAVYSGLTQSALNGTVSFNTDRETATGMPTGTLKPGTVVTAHIKVTNTGTEPETYELDPRTMAQSTYAAESLTNTGGTLPVVSGGETPQYAVPPFSTKLHIAAHTSGSTPMMFDISPYWGAPDVLAPASKNGSTSLNVNDPLTSEWGVAPDEVGPFPPSGTTSESYSTSGSLRTLGFDETAVPSTGDIWADIIGGADEPLRLLFLRPGHTGTMTVTFTVPDAAAGTKVSGQVGVETIGTNSFTSGIGDWGADVLGMAKYSYTVGASAG